MINVLSQFWDCYDPVRKKLTLLTPCENIRADKIFLGSHLKRKLKNLFLWIAWMRFFFSTLKWNWWRCFPLKWETGKLLSVNICNNLRYRLRDRWEGILNIIVIARERTLLNDNIYLAARISGGLNRRTRSIALSGSLRSVRREALGKKNAATSQLHGSSHEARSFLEKRYVVLRISARARRSHVALISFSRFTTEEGKRMAKFSSYISHEYTMRALRWLRWRNTLALRIIQSPVNRKELCSAYVGRPTSSAFIF